MRKPETLAEAEGWKDKTIVDKWGCRHVVKWPDHYMGFGIYFLTHNGDEITLEEVNWQATIKLQ